MSLSIKDKPKVLALMEPKNAGEDYLAKFKSKFQLDVSLLVHQTAVPCSLKIGQVLHVKNHKEAVPAIADAVAKQGPYYAFIILMGTAPFEPFNENMFGPLLPECKIIVSASAGYNEFPVEVRNPGSLCSSRSHLLLPLVCSIYLYPFSGKRFILSSPQNLLHEECINSSFI